MLTCLLHALWLGAAVAAPPPAAELALHWSTFPDVSSQGEMVYLDVLGSPVPPVQLKDVDGQDYRLNIRLEYVASTEELVIRPHLFEVKKTRAGETLVPVGDTELRTTSGARGSVRFGTDGKNPPKTGIELDFTPKIGGGVMIPPPPPPKTEEPAGPVGPDVGPAGDDEFIQPAPGAAPAAGEAAPATDGDAPAVEQPAN